MQLPDRRAPSELLRDGDDIYDPSKRLEDARKSIGMGFQKPNRYSAMSIYDNVVSGLKLTDTRSTKDERDSR